MRPHRRRGANVIEFSLLLPVYLGLVFATVDYGWMMYHWTALQGAAQNACREGALMDPDVGESAIQAIVDSTDAALIGWVEVLGPGCGSGCLTDVQAVGDHPSRALSCTVSMQYQPLVGFTVRSTRLSANATTHMEFQRSE